MSNNNTVRQNNRNKNHTPVGRQIRATKVVCLDVDGKNLGTMALSEALSLADSLSLDLVQITPIGKDVVPTCKITDYGKYKYNQSKKQKLAAKKQRESVVKVKEIKFRPSTDVNDLRTKAKHAEEFLEEGNRVRVSILFKGREIAYTNLAYQTLNEFIGMISNIQILEKPSIQGKMLSVLLGTKGDKLERFVRTDQPALVEDN